MDSIAMLLSLRESNPAYAPRRASCSPAAAADDSRGARLLAEPGEPVLRLAGADGRCTGALRRASAQPILHSRGVLPSRGQGRQRLTRFPAQGFPLRMALALEIGELLAELTGQCAD